MGYYLAKSLDVSVAGSISVVIGGVFAIVFTATTLRKSKIDVISN
jgi:hypothetical protein